MIFAHATITPTTRLALCFYRVLAEFYQFTNANATINLIGLDIVDIVDIVRIVCQVTLNALL